jgi:hypothetical protein
VKKSRKNATKIGPKIDKSPKNSQKPRKDPKKKFGKKQET